MFFDSIKNALRQRLEAKANAVVQGLVDKVRKNFGDGPANTLAGVVRTSDFVDEVLDAVFGEDEPGDDNLISV